MTLWPISTPIEHFDCTFVCYKDINSCQVFFTLNRKFKFWYSSPLSYKATSSTMKNCPHMRMSSLEEDNLVALYYLNVSDIWSDKSCGLWWEEPYKRGTTVYVFQIWPTVICLPVLLWHWWYMYTTCYTQCTINVNIKLANMSLGSNWKKKNSGILSFHWSKVLYTLLLQPMVLQYSNDAVMNKNFESDEFAAGNLLAFLIFILIFNTVEER